MKAARRYWRCHTSTSRAALLEYSGCAFAYRARAVLHANDRAPTGTRALLWHDKPTLRENAPQATQTSGAGKVSRPMHSARRDRRRANASRKPTLRLIFR